MPRVLCDTAQRWLADLPPYEQDSKDFQGTLHAIGKEAERFEAAKDKLRRNFWPQTADDQLGVYEAEFGLSVNPPDKTTAQRQTSVLAEERKLRGDGTGLSWQDNMTALVGTGWSYREHDPADGTSPAANTLLIRVPYTTAIASPAEPTGVAGAGGALPADTYHYKVTATNFYGETLPSSPARDVVVTAGQQVTLDWPDVAGATGYAVFRSRDGDASGFHRIANITVSAYVDAALGTLGAAPPTVNTTESFQAYEAKALARRITPAHLALNFTYGAGFILGVSRLGDAL